ncbi:hypothetical protein FKW77_001233 [Venturia effusa]|uniref:Heterokaryon incompatibility domain-containing protein n=1 Tax=Venturia effusa TaxID=50376 RepID=A0A517LES5_9PEZI|nr:hypothetical protein FKW77_001233 [Venturia effusa]
MYNYQPLSDNFIRLLHLLPGQFEHGLVVNLQHERFDPAAASPIVPEYEALSYTWGTGDSPSPVEVLSPHSGQLPITKNLDIAMRHLRYPDRPRTLWIDAICIDQANSDEKGSQVAIMGDIYRLANRVVAWLGPAENDSDHAMRLIRDISCQIEVDFRNLTMKSIPGVQDQSIGDISSTLRLTSKDLTALYHLFGRSWFERLWVRQEIYLASGSAMVSCGSNVIPWLAFRRAWACIHWKPFTTLSGEFDRQWMHRKTDLHGFLFQQNGIIFPYLRRQLGAVAKCADPKDRVFALLSLDSSNKRGLGIVPDYNASTADVYKDAALRCMTYFGDFGVLAECELSESGSARDGRSWVPDWSLGTEKRVAWPTTEYLASGPFVSPFEVHKHLYLRVLIVPTGTIRTVHEFKIQGASSSERIRSLKTNLERMTADWDLLQDYITGGSLLHAIAQTLLLGVSAESYEPLDVLRLCLRESEQALQELMAMAENSSPLVEPSSFYDTVNNNVDDRAMFETQAGHIGLAPRFAAPGDEVFAVVGSAYPMILRKKADDLYEVVGPCYIAGLQQGEAILGPMPEDWRRVMFRLDSMGHVPRFYNERTGEVSVIDPRLRNWPVDTFQYSPSRFSKYPGRYIVNASDLQKQGIHARYIDLV